MSARFEPINAHEAFLHVQSPSLFTCRRDGDIYQLGYHDAPRYSLEPTEGDHWMVHLHPERGAITEGAWDDPQLQSAIQSWSAGSRARRGLRLLEQLPPGRYHVIRSQLPAEAASTIAMGQDFLDATPNLRVLHTSVPACVVGSQVDTIPALDQPLVGAVMLNARPRVMFFSFAPPADHDDGHEDLVLVIPCTGETVIGSDEACLNWELTEEPIFAATCRLA